MEDTDSHFTAKVAHKYQITFNRNIRKKLQNDGIEVRTGDQIVLAFVRKVNGGSQTDNDVAKAATMPNGPQVPGNKLVRTTVRFFHSDLELYRSRPDLQGKLNLVCREFIHEWLISQGYIKADSVVREGGDRGRGNTAKEEGKQPPGSE